MRLTRTKLHMTSAFHPQADGLTEAANKVITMYLRCLTGDCPPPPVATLAAMGEVHLQHSLSSLPQRQAIQDHLWPRPTLHLLLRAR
jgi:hypothetical protein